ncbi:iron-containing redox enzyme family protein [Wolbachia endosymbiont of Onchocerca gibsoni]|uniref:iron-containing redox enzyme family protein n=1 Tax=Wolbachia endosymbiont of Onchocerca gibsoni TaxID=118986 RepID=UPI0023D7FDCD|nr:iron-containing redox enzyme family protein [Wolbachia endosymbiont of Onchocerca gibsoni]
MKGKLSFESYKFTLYHVAAFLYYISNNVHSLYQNLKMQQILFNNLIKEKQDDENHLELRQCFAKRFGVTWPDLYDFTICLRVLHAYEHQAPKVSKSKIEDLKKYYSISDKYSLQFFTIHTATDEWHTDEYANFIVDLNKEKQEKVVQSPKKGIKFLSILFLVVFKRMQERIAKYKDRDKV